MKKKEHKIDKKDYIINTLKKQGLGTGFLNYRD
jgi:hypothetical protein